jgi:glycosyltransferase involved in cell wall biosynthesis
MSGTFDIVHGIDARPVVIVPALWRKLRAGTPLVLSWWDMFGAGGTARERWGAVYGRTLGMLEGKWESAFRRYADRATVISTSLATRLEALGYPPERILLQRVGCDTRRHAPGDKLSARRDLGLAADATILCYVGALLKRDQRLLEEALRLLATRYERELSVLMVGTPVGGFGGAGGVRVQWVERQPLDGVYRYLAASDLCLLPLCESAANRARWPSKVADYFNAGRPVVATKVSDLEQLYATYSLGYLADHSTPGGYAEALLRALGSRPEWDGVGRSARRFAELHLDTRVLGNELLALYADAQRARS